MDVTYIPPSTPLIVLTTGKRVCTLSNAADGIPQGQSPSAAHCSDCIFAKWHDVVTFLRSARLEESLILPTKALVS